MAGAMRKVGEYLGLVEQADFDDEFDDEVSTPVPVKREREREERRPAVVRATTVASLEEHRRADRHDDRGTRSHSLESHAALYRIETVTPRTYNDARSIGETFREGTPVIMILAVMDDTDV